MKKVIVTGAGGFIGSHLAEECVRRDFDVTAFVHYNSRNSWGWLEGSPLKGKMRVLAGDIRDFNSVKKAIVGADMVFHLAALIGIPYSYESPLAYIHTNIEGTYNVLEAAKELKIENVVVTSTSETYGSAQYVPIDEKHPLVGQSPYSATKIAADQLAVSFHRSFQTPVKIARPFNTYGPRQSARAIIPTMITQILHGAHEIKLGNITPTRDLNYVKDVVRGFLAIAETDRFNGEIVNIGNGSEISIGDLAALISRLINMNVRIKTDESRIRPENSEVDRLHCCNKKIISATNWRPEYDLQAGLIETIEWFRKNLDIYKADMYNV